jgi:lysophospholipase L1-like esterase
MKKIVTALALLPTFAGAQFALHNGDRVVFYGDSITDQRLYTFYTEVFIRTRFPKLNIGFVHSGWGGDRVTGGGGGDIEQRIVRDVLPYKPTMVTIMLGMNDAGYRPFDQGLFDTYTKGYEHIVDRIRRDDAGVRFTFILPSPFDDVTRPVSFPGGYNSVLLRYAEFLKDLSRHDRALVADFNSPEVAMLQAANTKDPALAPKIIPDRVHPGDAGHLTMAEALLKSWNAPSTVSSVEFQAGKVVHAENAWVSHVSTQNGLSWTELEGALPFPINLNDPATRLVADSSDLVQALDQETVKVSGLTGRYALSIDGKTVGTYSSDDLAAGVNLATLDTPMRAQAQRVFDLTRKRGEAHNQRWRSIQTNWLFGTEREAEKQKDDALAALDRYDFALDRAARKAAQPVPHQFSLTLSQ